MRYLVLLLLFACAEETEFPMGCGVWTDKATGERIEQCAPKYNAHLEIDGNIRVAVLYDYQWYECSECN